MMTFRATKLARAQEVLSKMTPKPKVLLEFGTFVGSSAVGWGAILKDLHKDDPDALKQSRVYTFELDPEIANIARFFISLAGLEDIVTVLDGKPASECLRELYNQGKVVKGGVDAAFFDHAKEHYVPDLKLVGDELGLFRVGSVAIADNTDFPGAPEYVEFMRRGGDRVKFDSKTYLGDEPGTKAVSYLNREVVYPYLESC